MSKPLIKIFTYVDGVNDTPFPNEENQLIIPEYSFSESRMGSVNLTATAMYPTCLDDKWVTGKQYADFRGERYFIVKTPSSSKSNDDVRYKHDIEFVSERNILETIYFYDVVSDNTSVDRYVSNSTKVLFYGDVHELVARLNYSLEYSQVAYRLVVDAGITSEVKQVSLEDVFVFDAIQEIFNIFELPFYFVGKTCHVGFTDNAITHTFRYGKDYELLSINKTNANYKITNRVTGTGSSDNIQFYYPNPSNDRAAIEAAGGKWITPASTLMPPIYRDTDGAERFYNAINKRYINPETGEYYVFENEFTTASQKEQIVTFEDIKPTIKNTLNAAGLRIDEIIDVAFDKDDNDEVDESTGDYVHSYFYVKLNRFSGDYGFNLFEQPIVGSDASIVMTSGNCNACTFQIGVIEVEEDGKTVFKNPVQVDKNGNIAEGNYADKVKPNNIQASQQDTTQNEVWIALKKDNTTFGMVMPNKNGNIRPSYGDSFVITNIDMPQTYIYKAENELEEAILKYMANNNSEKFTFSIKLSRIFLAENPAVEALINSSARIDLEYNGKYHQLYVSSYTYRSDSEVLPEITIELADTLTISKNSIQTSIDSVKQDIMNTIGGVDFLKQGLKYFLRKDTEDIARFFISFLRGIKIGNYVSGGDIGGIFAVDGNGKTFIETDFLKVRMKAYFETLEIINTGSIAGRQIITPGGSIKCIKVVDREEIINEDGEKEEKIWNFYRCYFLAEQDGVKVENRFRKNDQALSQDFNIKEGVYENVSNHYYWRLVVGVGDDYIDLSKTDADTNSDAPAIGDVICQLGHRDNKVPERQNAMIFSAVDLYSPSLTMYAGINSYSYVNKDYISYGVDKTTNKAFMNVYGDTYIGDRNRTSYMEFKTGKGLKIKGQLEVGSTIGNGSTIEDALDKATQDAIDAATEDLTNYAKEVAESLNNIQYQIDGQIESFFEKYSPTLTNKPAVDWTTEELKKQHANDTFTNIETGESWKWVKDGTTWKWSVIEDTATLKALAAASKAQDTADGKRRVFVAKPTTEQVYDIGDLWVNATYGTTYHNDILRAKTAKKAGEAFNISHWELASKYTDDTKANEAAAAAAEAQEAAEQAATAVDNLNTYVDGAFKDGVIEESEAQAIEKYINIVDNAKKTTDAAYTKLYANTYLTGAAKTGLKSAKDKLDIATTNLINSINTAIADGQTTVAEKNDVDAKFAAYNTANEAFSTAVEVANGAIQDLLKSYSDQAIEAAVAAQAAADAAQAAADSASDAVDDLNGYVDGAFKDGVIDEAEAKAIEKYINVVNGSKAATDATYTKLYSNKYLLGTAKENLKTAKDKLDVATTALLTSIQSAIADGKTTAEEKAAVDAKYADFNKANEDFNTAIEAANLSIQNMLKSYADAALAAAEAAQTSADAAKEAADNAAGAVGDLNDYVDGAFKDGIIDASEAQAIEKYINIVNNTKGEVKATFDKLYANVYLTGAAKTGLNSSCTALNTAITNLLNSINTAIADGKTTEAEKADVDSKYASFNTAYSSFNTAVETANKAIQDKLKTFADDAKALAESAQAVADAAKDRLDSWAEDGVISPTEKQGIKDEIARIKADKDNITAGYLLYNLGEATAYNTAYTDYYNSLLALSDTTKETIEIPTDFATKQTKYYTERTAALNAIASASKSAVDAAQAAADAAKSRLDSWAADGVISPAEKQSIKDERARILADKADITTGYTRYNLGTPTEYNTAYTAYDTALAALSKDTPEVITIPSDFATKQKNYYTKRTAAISAIDAATKSNADAAATAAAKAQEDIDNVKTDINKINSDVAGLKNFTDDAFADGVVDRGEASAIGAYLKSIATVKADVDKSYTEVYANPLLAGTAKTTLNTTYTAFGKAVEELTTVIEAVVEKGIADATDRASVNGKYDAFNTKYGAFVAALNAANTYIQDQIESKAQSALDEAISYRYLSRAFNEYTTINGGLIQNSLNVLGYTNDKKEFVVQAGMSGLYDASARGGGIAAWYGGSMKDYFDYTDLDRPKDVAKGVDRMDGTGYRANGNLWWDLNGKVHADPLSFFVGKETVGGLLASFQVVMTNDKPDYIIPQVPFQDLTISNNLTVGGDIILKDGILKWDAANNAFYVEKKDGSIASFYATGEVSAGGAGSGGSGGGGGLIENVYGSSSLGDEFSDSDLNNTFNAYSINQIYLDVKNLKSGAAVSLVVNGTGTVLTNIVKTGSTITATKGNLAFSSLTSKPTTIAGYGITDAYTKTQADGKYVLKSGSNMTGALNWTDADSGVYAMLLGTNHYIGIDGTSGSSMLHWDGTRTHVGSLNGSVAIRSNATDLIHNYNGTGYIILDARNYNNYAPKKDGTGASGTWGINVNGYAHRLHQALGNKTAEQVFTDNGVYYYQVSSAEDTGYPSDYGHGLMLQRSSGDTLTSSQAVLDIFTPISSANLVYLRTGIGNGTKITWQAFQRILHTGNYTSLITKLGTATVGSNTKFFYLNAGTPTASNASIGTGTHPIYLNGGVFTASTSTVGSASRGIYMTGGLLTAMSATVGSASLPVYMNAGTITQCSTTLGVSITGTAPRLTTTELTNQDLNSYTYTNYSGKLYYAGGSNTTTNVPSQVGAYGLMVLRNASSYTAQLMISSAGNWYSRTHSGTAWDAWNQLAHITDNVASATKLQTARTINGTSFNGTANITTAKWGTARTLAIAAASKSIDGSTNITISRADMNVSAGDESIFTGTTVANTWYRIASSPVNISSITGIFSIYASASGYHTNCLLTVSTSYGSTASTSIQQLSCAHYGNPLITQARIVYHTTYNAHYAYLEILVPTAITSTFVVRFSLPGQNFWALNTSLVAGSIPSGYTSKAITLKNSCIVANVTGNLTGNVTGNLTGNASTATSLQTARTLWGQSFNGTANITGTLLGVESLVARSGRINNFSGYFDDSGNPATGTICITLPNGWTSSMNIYEIWIYEYNTTANASVITIGAYNYNGDGTASSAKWVNIGYHTKGAYSKGVRLAYNGSKCVILLGTTATKWYYPKVYLKTIYTGHSNQTIWGRTSTISLITSETGYTNIDTPARMDEFFGDTSVTGKLAVTGAGHFGHTYTSMTAGINVKGDSATTGICLYDGTGTTAHLYRKRDILYITRAGNDASGILMSVAGSIYPGANNTLTNGTTTNRWSNVCTQLLNVAGVGTFASHIAVSGEVRSTSAKAFRAVYNSYGFFIYNDGNSSYFMLTAKDDQYGTYNSLRPLYINNSTGIVTMGNGTNILGILNVSNTTDATATTVAAIKTAGGIGVAKQLRVGGAVTFGSTLSVTGQITASGGLRIGNYYLKSTADGLALTHVTTGTVANFYATGEVSAGGVGSGGSGGGGGLIENVYGYSKLDGEYKDTDLNNTFNAYTIAQINKRVVSLEGGSALTVTTTGSGNAVTSVAKSGTAITVTKGSTFVTTNTAQTISVEKIWTVSQKMNNTSIKRVNSLTGSNATGGLWYTADYAAVQFGIGVYTDKNASPRGFIGWTSEPWQTANNLTVSETSLTYKGNAILHAANYNTYAPTKTGGGASGSWGINITGNAATATTANRLVNIGGVNWTTLADATGNGIRDYVDTTTEGRWMSYGTVLQISNVNNPDPGVNGHWLTQILSSTSNLLGVRWRTNTGAWSGVQTIVTSGNYTSYVTKVGTATIGAANKGIYLNAGTPTAMSSTVGSTTVPVYMNAGAITVCSTTLGVSITGNAKTATSLQTARTLWGQSFNGTANITGTLLGVESLVARSGRINNFSGYFDDSGNPATGTICITLPNGWTSSMNIYEIWIYEYNTTANASVITIGAYNYNGDGTASSAKWVNIGYHTKGAYSKGVRLAYNGSKCVILLGTTATKWYYPKVYLKTIYTGHSNQTIWGRTSTISLITSETGYTNIDTPARMDEFFGDTSVTGKLAVTGAGHFGHTYTSMTAGINVKGDSATTGICLYDGTGTTAHLYRKRDILYITRAGNDASGILMSVAGSIYPGANNTLTNGTTTNRWSNVCTQLLNVAGVGTFASHIAVSGEVRSTSAKAFRAVYNSYGFFIYNDGNSSYFMLTAKDDQYGTYNSLRPLYINNSTGIVTMGNGTNILGILNVSNTTDATATTVAAIKTAGGIGVAKQLRVGGAVTFGSTLSVTGQITASGGLRIGNYYLKSTADGLALTHVTTGTVANFYATGEVSAGGVGSGGSGGGGGLIENVYGYSKLDGEYKDTDLNNTFNAYTIAQINKRVVSLEGGSALTVTTTGSGNAVTSVAKSGTAITVTKGSTFVTTNTAQTISVEKIWTVSQKMNNTSIKRVNSLTGSNATGGLWYTADYAAVQFGIGVYTDKNASPRGFIGWTSEPWQTANNLTVSETSLTYKGNAILHAANYNTYAPTKTGGGASGSWGINITGNAATATTANRLVNIGGVNWTTLADATGNGIRDYVDTTTEGRWMSYGTVLQISNVNNPDPGVNGHWLTQILSSTSNLLGVRWRTNTGAWSGVQTIVTSGNYTSYVTKVGTATIGAANKGIYLNAGTPTAMSSTVGSTTVPVYMNAGAITVCSTTLGVSITGNAKTATTLQTTRKIFSQPFSGAGDVAGQAMVYGTYQETASSRYLHGGLQIRENGLVGNKQTADGYAPAIGFHWGNRIGASLILTTSGFKFMNQAFTGYQNVYGIFKGNADSATQVYNTETNPTSGTWYAGTFITDSTTGNKYIRSNNGFAYYSLEGTASAQGEALIRLGTPTATGTAGNKRGRLVLYSSSSGCGIFVMTTTTGAYTFTFPAATGTVALTSSNVASATKLQTARTLWGQSFNGTANVSGSMTGVGPNIVAAANITMTTTGEGNNISLKYNNDDTKSVVLNTSAFKPFDLATNKLNLGTTSARWLGLYANTGNFSSTLYSASTVTGTRFISTVATGTAPLAVNSTTVVTNLNADMVDGIHSSNIPLEYDASYKPTGTAARWIRIAYFDYSSANYSWSGTFAITNNYANNENKGLIFNVSTAHGTTSPVITQIGGSGGVFISIRIVKDTTTEYPTTAKVYLEVYYNSTSANNYVYVSYKPANRAIGKWTLYTTYTAGSIPTGHTAIAKLYTTSGLSTTANLRVQGTAVILGATNHNNRLDIQSDGKIVPHSTATRRSGVYGVYDSAKIGHIWSMGTNYMIADDGSGFGTLYGFAYQYSSSLRATGHQAVWCVNGNPRVAIGNNFWVANAATIGGTLAVTGAGSVNTLTIKNTEAVGHLKFSRGSFNYITAPASGTIAFIVNGQAVGEATADLIIQNGVLKAGAANATALGQDTHRWSNMYSVLLNVSGVATLSSTVNIAGVLNANNATDATSTTAAGAVFDGGVGIVKQLRVGGNVTIGGNVTFATSGLLSVPYSGGQWISLATRTNLIAGNQNTSETSAHALYRVKSFAGDAVVFGGLKNSIGFYGLYKARIDSGDNNYDWRTVWDSTTGKLLHSKAFEVFGATTLNSTLTVASTGLFNLSTDATSTTAAAVRIVGGLAVGKQLRVGGAVTLSSTLSVSSTLNVSGVVNANNATDATSTTAASLVCDGGVGIVKQLRVGGATTLSSTLSVAGIVSFTNATDATSTTAAAVKVTGGLGVAKQLRVGSNAVFTKGIYINGNTTGDESITLGTSGDKKIKMGAGGSPGTRWSEIAFFPNFTNNGGFTDINLNIQAEGTIQMSSQAKFIWISGGNIAASGEVSAGSTSDRNLKKNFSLEDYQQRVLDLGMVQDFEYREEEMKRAVRTYKPGRHTSLIAQDIKSCTSMVSKDKDGYLKINPLDKEFLFTVVGAVQLNVLGLREVKSEVEILKDEIRELKKRIEFLESLK